jgi:putative RecB family exonuclease
MPVYSNSRLATYESCPQQYKLRYIDKIKVEGYQTIEQFLGSRVHDALEKLYKDLVLTKLNTLDDLLGHFQFIWDREWRDDIVIVRQGYTKSHYRDSGKKCLTHYYNRYQPFDREITIANEYPVNLELDGYKLTGFIDRLCHDGRGGYQIHDYKTGGRLPVARDLEEDRQLALYQIGVQQNFRDAKRIDLVWHYLMFDQEMVSRRTPAQLKDLKKQIVWLIKTIEKDTKFQPKESALCDWCEYPDFCPAKAHERKTAELPANKYLKEPGVVLVNKYAALRAKAAELNKKIKEIGQEQDEVAQAALAYARKHQLTKIAGNGCALVVERQTKVQFPRAGEEGREELEKAVKKAGIWEEVSKLDIGALERKAARGGLDDRNGKKILEFAETGEQDVVRLVAGQEGAPV